jgi:hypothetical protein
MAESTVRVKRAPASHAGWAEKERPMALTVTCWHDP